MTEVRSAGHSLPHSAMLLVRGGEPQKATFLNSSTFKHQCNKLQHNEIVYVMDHFAFLNCQARIVRPEAMMLYGILKCVIHYLCSFYTLLFMQLATANYNRTSL